MRRSTQLATAALLAIASPSALRAQQGLDPDLAGRCAAALAEPNLELLCLDAVAGMQLLQPELGLVLAGGNPVLGTASPIGRKFRAVPRIYLGGRINLVWVDVPDIVDYPDDALGPLGTRGFAVPMPQLGVSVGVFSGLDLTPTLGGLASVELLGRLGALILPGGEGFENDATGFGLGARIGVLRESFTAPGISLSGQYSWLGRVRFGDVAEGSDAQFGMDLSVTSFRVGLSKSFVSFGLALTLAYDWYDSDVDLTVLDSSTGLALDVPVIPEDERGDLDSGRWSAFVDVSYIVLFISIVAELGWQEERSLTVSRGSELQAGNLFSSIGVRLSL